MFYDSLSEVTLDRAQPLRMQVYALVRRAIIAGQLLPGAAINEVEIASKLGVSRTPVREAVKKAVDEGLVDVFVQRGTFVASINRQQVEEAYIVRMALEAQSARFAAKNARLEQLHALEDILHDHEMALKRQKFARAMDQDDAFHMQLALVSDFSNLWRSVELSKAHIDRCRTHSIPAPGAGVKTIQEHRAILAAVADKDSNKAEAAMRTHLETSLRETLRYLDSLASD